MEVYVKEFYRESKEEIIKELGANEKQGLSAQAVEEISSSWTKRFSREQEEKCFRSFSRAI